VNYLILTDLKEDLDLDSTYIRIIFLI